MSLRITSRPPRARLRQVSGLDGLRGLAVAAVVIYHFFGTVLPGGYLGVDMFFVLSGFLITSLLVREHRVTGSVSLKDFWIRRFRRILPAAMVVLCLCTGMIGVIGGDLAVGLRTQFLGTAFFASNWVQIATAQSYFADNQIQVFAHYWSLAVEEQFYVLWPLLFMGLAVVAGRHFRKAMGTATVFLGALSAGLMAWLYEPGADPTRVYYGTDTHSFGLLTGALLALILCSRSRQASADSWPLLIQARQHVQFTAGFFGVLALAVYVGQLFMMKDTADVTYLGGLLTTSLLVAVMIWSVVREAQPMHWLFSGRVLRYLGQRSFSLYLWHWPVVMILKHLLDWPEWTVGCVALAISLGLTEVSYRYVESPIRRGGYGVAWHRYVAAPRTVGWYAVPVVLVVALAGAGFGVATSSNKTQLEKDLEQLAAQNAQLAAAPLSDTPSPTPAPTPAPTGTPTRKKVHPLPKGPTITAIGDSAMLASSAALQQRFPGIYIDAAVSRHYTAALGIVQQLEAQGQLRDTVFLGFGTNGATMDDQMEQLIKAIGPKRTIILAVPYGDRAWMPPAREEVIAAAKKHKNVYIADWCSHAQANPAALRDDAIHPTLDGAVEYSKAFYYATLQYSYGDKNTSTQCR